MKVVSFFALSLVVCFFGCREQEAEKASPPRDEIIGAATDSVSAPKTTASKRPAEKNPLKEPVLSEGPKPHPYTIRPGCAAFSPDGKQVLIGFGHDMFVLTTQHKPPGWSVQLFEVESGKHLRTLNGHQGDVDFVAFFPDGKTAISAGRDGWFRVWDLDKGVEVRRFRGNVDHAAMLPDGKRLLGSSSRLQLWDAVEGKLLNEYDEFQNSVSSITISPDGKRAILGCVPGGNGFSDSTLMRLWDVENGKVARKFDPKKDRLGNPNAFSEDSKFAVSVRWHAVTQKAAAVLWEVPSGNETNEFPAFAFVPYAIYLSLKENRIVLAGGQGELVCLDAKSGKEAWATKGPAVEFFVFSANGKLGLSAAGGVTKYYHQRMDLVLWNTETGKELRRLTPNFDEPQPPLPANDP